MGRAPFARRAFEAKRPRLGDFVKNVKRKIKADDLLRFRFITSPRISPDGERVVFANKRVGEKNRYKIDLWTVSATGKAEPTLLTNGESDALPRWSPGGTRISFVRSGKERDPQIYLIDPRGGEAAQLTHFPEGSIRDQSWSPDGTMLAVVFRETIPQLTRAARKEREKEGSSTPPLIVDHPIYREDGDGYFGSARFALYLVDTKSGEHRRIFHAPLGIDGFSWSPDSRELAVVANLDRQAALRPWMSAIYRVNVRSEGVTQVAGPPEGPKADVQWSPDGRMLAYAGRLGRDEMYSSDNSHLWVVDARGGKARNLSGRTDFCLMATCLSDAGEPAFGPRFCWMPSSRELLVQLGWHGESHLALLSRRGGEFEFLTAGAYIHNLGSVSREGSRIALTRGSAQRLDDVYVGDLAKISRKKTARKSRGSSGQGRVLELRELTDFNGSLVRELSLAPIQSKWIRAADGSRIQVWSMFPVGSGPRRKLPAVLEIHGGPHAQYGVGFFHEFQMLAAAGYAVFFSNPRGSKGYGEKHCNAIRGSWGGADWADIQAVMEHMQEHPRVDAKRMGVMGGSYGGYMTNWVIGHTRAFRAAITDRCVSNLISMSGNSDYLTIPNLYWPGNAWDQPEPQWNASPLKYLGSCRTPTMIIHSEGDLRCNIEQAEQVYAVLTLHGVPVRFIRYPRETSHGMSRSGPPDLRLHRLGQILDWWGKWLKSR